MAISKLEFTKDWTNVADFPTYEPSEAKVRADMQYLHDETKEFLNDMIDELTAENIPFTATAAIPAENVQAAVENVQQQVAQAAAGEIPDGTITSEKLAGPVSVAKGGTGAETAAGALTNLLNGSKGVIKRDNLAASAMCSPTMYIRETTYNLTADDIGKTLLVLYSIRGENIVVNLTDANSKSLEIGAEIAIVRMWGANVTINTNGVRIGVPGLLSTGTGGLTTAAQHSFTISEPFGTVTLKKTETDANGDVWLVQGKLDMVS